LAPLSLAPPALRSRNPPISRHASWQRSSIVASILGRPRFRPHYPGCGILEQLHHPVEHQSFAMRSTERSRVCSTLIGAPGAVRRLWMRGLHQFGFSVQQVCPAASILGPSLPPVYCTSPIPRIIVITYRKIREELSCSYGVFKAPPACASRTVERTGTIAHLPRGPRDYLIGLVRQAGENSTALFWPIAG
jgi:hypothetical protein